MMAARKTTILALDVGAKRVGVAVASRAARLPQPLTTLTRDENFFSALKEVAASQAADTLVIGWPRGLQGQHTAQTDAIEDFAGELRQHFKLPIHYQDEALTSKRAEAELQARGREYAPGDIDALAATYILEDFLAEQPERERL